MEYSLKEDTIDCVFKKIKRLVVPSESNNYKSRFLQSNVLLYCVVLLLTLKIVTVLVSINFPQNIFFADITKSALENFANQTRQSIGLPALVENQKLNQAAQLKAENMVSNDYFSHTSPSGVTPWFWFSQAGYNYKYAGENLAIGFYDSKEVYDAWLNSPSHKANILNRNYTEVGTAVLNGFGQNNSIVVVQEFGTQLPNTGVKASQAPSKASPAVKTTPMDTGRQVLSQATEAQTKNPVEYPYDIVLQDVIYGVSLVVMGILLLTIFFNFYPVKLPEGQISASPKLFNRVNIKFKKELVFRAVLIAVLLSAAALLNREIIISFIPHQIII